MFINPSFQSVPAPATETLLEAKKRETQLDINCVKIGTIQSFDVSKQIATVKISQQQVVSITPQGVKTLQEYPILLQVPVFTLFGGVDFLSMPVSVGDNCILLFNDRELDNWLHLGDGHAPNTGRVHDLSDGIALVGVRPLTNSIATYLVNGIRLSHGSGGNISKMDLTNALIECTATLFRINGNLTVTGNLNVEGTGGVDTATVGCNLTQTSGKVLKAGNGATGTFQVVYVADGIVTGGEAVGVYGA